MEQPPGCWSGVRGTGRARAAGWECGAPAGLGLPVRSQQGWMRGGGWAGVGGLGGEGQGSGGVCFFWASGARLQHRMLVPVKLLKVRGKQWAHGGKGLGPDS